MKLRDFDVESFQNETLKRMIEKMSEIGDAVLDPKKYSQLRDALTNMKNIFAKAKVPRYKDGSVLYSLEPEITNILENSRNPEELKYYWTKWHDMTGKPNANDFWKYVQLRNEAAKANGEWMNNFPTFDN